MPEKTVYSMLLIEDDPGDAALILRNLRDSRLGSFATTSASCLADARTTLERRCFDAVLTDLGLPDSVGMDTVRAVLAVAGDRPVVVLTGQDDETAALQALELGAQDYLIKGEYRQDSLGRALHHAMARARADKIGREKALLEKLVIERRKAAQALEEVNSIKSAFLHNVSHELRTPLNGIQGMLDMLATSPLSEEQRKWADIGLQSTQRLSTLMTDILHIARIDAGYEPSTAKPFTVSSLFTDLEHLFAEAARKKGLWLHFSADPDLPALLGDAPRLRHLLFNLVGNAIKFTHQGEVVVTAKRILGADERPDLVPMLFTVQDSGIGISMEHREAVFKPFFQVDYELNRRFDGAGLGLAVVEHLARQMDGYVTLDSEPGKGTSVHLSLCLQEACGR
jgi:signal transduction histidine kinase